METCKPNNRDLNRDWKIKKLFIEVVVQRFLEVNPGKYTKEVTDFEKYIEI